jgi:hypothetical protein
VKHLKENGFRSYHTLHKFVQYFCWILQKCRYILLVSNPSVTVTGSLCFNLVFLLCKITSALRTSAKLRCYESDWLITADAFCHFLDGTCDGTQGLCPIYDNSYSVHISNITKFWKIHYYCHAAEFSNTVFLYYHGHIRWHFSYVWGGHLEGIYDLPSSKDNMDIVHQGFNKFLPLMDYLFVDVLFRKAKCWYFYFIIHNLFLHKRLCSRLEQVSSMIR